VSFERILPSKSIMMIELEKEMGGHPKPIENLLRTLHAFYESTRSIRLFIAPDLTVLFFNKKGLEQIPILFGKKLKTGITITKLLKKSDITEAFIHHFEIALEGVSTSAEFLLGLKGEKEWYLIEFHVVAYGKETTGVSISLRNITDRKKKELQLNYQQELLNQIIHDQSHVFRLPVANIIGLVANIDRTELSENNREMIEYIEQSAMKLDKIINEIVTSAHSTRKNDDTIN
jgi:signal transduction histidine kinase